MVHALTGKVKQELNCVTRDTVVILRLKGQMSRSQSIAYFMHNVR